jgi:hypothetical protein
MTAAPETRAVHLLESVRTLACWLLLVMVMVAVVQLFMFDYLQGNRANGQDTRARIEELAKATDRIEEQFTVFNGGNTQYLDNHAKTQRLICNWYEANDVALPVNGDCDNR